MGLVCVYDAVPVVRPDGSLQPVPSCGHGPIAGGVAACALALADLRQRLVGRIVVVGCPADEIHAPGTAERGGGKLLSLQAGAWEGIDVPLYAHPEALDTVTLRWRWMRRQRLAVVGARSLSRRPEPPARAAAALLRAGGRDMVVERLSLDGDVEEGTGLVLRADVLCLGDSEAELEERCAALRRRVREGEWQSGPTAEGVRADPAVTAAVAEAFRVAGRPFVPDPPPLPFATDFGNISRRPPAALIGIGRPGGWAFHRDEEAAQFVSAAGEEAALAIARVLALAAARLAEPT